MKNENMALTNQRSPTKSGKKEKEKEKEENYLVKDIVKSLLRIYFASYKINYLF